MPRDSRKRYFDVRTIFLLSMMLTTAHAQGVDSLDTPKQWPAGPLKDYFEKLQRPDNYNRPNTPDGPSRSCCGAGDVVKTKFKVEVGNGKHPEDVWYAWLKGKWTKIPPETIVPDYAPDGKAYLFMLALYDPHGMSYDYQIVCFVRPKGGI